MRHRMKKLRLELGLTQVQVAKILGIWFTGYSQIEGGGGCRLPMAKKITDLYSRLSGEKLCIDDLFFDEVEEKKGA